MDTKIIELESTDNLTIYDLNSIWRILCELNAKTIEYNSFKNELHALANASDGKIVYENVDMLYPYMSELSNSYIKVFNTVDSINYNGIMNKIKEENEEKIKVTLNYIIGKINQYNIEITNTQSRSDLLDYNKSYIIDNANYKIAVANRDKTKLEQALNNLESQVYSV